MKHFAIMYFYFFFLGEAFFAVGKFNEAEKIVN